MSTRALQRSGIKLEHFVKPMLADTYEKPFSDEQWVFEVKWDGYRAVADIGKSETKLYSRNGLSFETLYPVVFKELKKIRHDVILDGEIVVLDQHGLPSFQKLQHYEENKTLPILYYVFDCVSCDGVDLKSRTLIERKEIVKSILPQSDIIKYCDHVEEIGEVFFQTVLKHNLEGMIAKRADSLYYPGRRSSDWLKIKNHKIDEAIITGFTAPRGSRPYFGALILGAYHKGKLTYIGHTGTGFTEKLLKEVYNKLKPHIQKKSPFEEKIKVNSPVTWVNPSFVCNIKYTERTEDGMMRHPVFMGLRIDKKPDEVVL